MPRELDQLQSAALGLDPLVSMGGREPALRTGVPYAVNALRGLGDLVSAPGKYMGQDQPKLGQLWSDEQEALRQINAAGAPDWAAGLGLGMLGAPASVGGVPGMGSGMTAELLQKWKKIHADLKAKGASESVISSIGDKLEKLSKVAETEVGPSVPWQPSPPGPDSLLKGFPEAQVFPPDIATRDVPTYLPTPIPERAKIAGFKVPLAHGTRANEPFSQFALPEERDPFNTGMPSAEVGVHAGSPKAANRFGGTDLYSNWDKPRVYPLVMRAEKPLEMPDLGNWGPSHIADFLETHPEFGKEAVNAALKGREAGYIRGKHSVEQIQALRKLIQDKGYDSIKYVNAVEDPGHVSYIALDPAQLRAPWAAFKDLSSRDLLSGLAGGAVVAPALTLGQRKD